MVKSPLTKIKKSKAGGKSPGGLKSPLIMIGGGGVAEAQRIAHGIADPKGINAKHKPGNYGEILKRAWGQVLPAFVPSEGSVDDFKEKMV